MQLRISRFYSGPDCTVGRFYVDNVLECFILEDRVREVLGEDVDQWKVKSQTAIPSADWLLSMGHPALYSVTIDMSTRFERDMPHILDVPGFGGIRFHPGNDDHDTEGCPLTGLDWSPEKPDWVGRARMAFDRFFPKLHRALSNGERVTLSVINQFPNELVTPPAESGSAE
jgi:hypothetical protein